MASVGSHELNFVQGKDEIAGDDDIDLRVELPCGHTAAPSSVLQWCRSCLEQGKTNFHCPALMEDGAYCKKEWKLAIIQSVAMNTKEGLKGMHDLEEKLATLTAKKYCEYKECPGCKSLVERGDQSNMRVFCTICKAKKKGSYEFCWQCLQPWEGDIRSSVGCASKECKDSNLDILQKCKLLDLPHSEIKRCPSIRACPTCGLLIEHKEMCKYIICCRCKVEFCFACLETAEVCQTRRPAANYMACAKPVAPKQTAIPVWSKESRRVNPPPGIGEHPQQRDTQHRFLRAFMNQRM
ncbi:E3 ubiquitin-protein ligase ARIH2-like [Ambystoma mexicanum]|uniref:E3 ubiquitin-protein ligase ARIH2-like n=1 Tax=Ambystoma mexicanum TaxID=8296 RepID=UPI0037E7466D